MKFVSTVRDIFHTIRHLKLVQISYRIKYGLKPVSSLVRVPVDPYRFSPLKMLPHPGVKNYVQVTENKIQMKFLNLARSYNRKIQWDDQRHGKLWNYHLQYADFLKQRDLPVDFRAKLILELYKWLADGKLQPEPYPASLRIMNVARYLSEFEVRKNTFNELTVFLNSELHFLENRLEYHLLGNHLLENAFALLMGGTAFNNRHWIQTAETIFDEQIPEQILEDGGHFERSPMYHLILLFRFFEAIYYLPSDSELLPVFRKASQKMLSWVDQMSFENGDVAHVNDSTNRDDYSNTGIVKLAKKCSVEKRTDLGLSESGYRKFKNERFELMVDAGGIEPSYQPGHAHADSLSFVLHIDKKPFLTDPGISTYDNLDRREWERSSKAHNTVTYNSQNTADVWSRFRVARRPVVTIQKESDSEIRILLKHRLKSEDNFVHKRNITVTEKFIKIDDEINLNLPVEARLFFDPEVNIHSLSKNRLECTGGSVIQLENVQQVSQFSYDYCCGFNALKKSKAIEYSFIKCSSLVITAPD